MDAIDKLSVPFAGLVEALKPNQRAQLSRDIANRVRASQSKRIADQLNPDGSAFAPRKPQLRAKKGRIRRAMFVKLRTTRYLKSSTNSQAATITFAPVVQRMAEEHQLGLRGLVNPHRKIWAKYPVRQLLGFSKNDVEQISSQVIAHLAR